VKVSIYLRARKMNHKIAETDKFYKFYDYVYNSLYGKRKMQKIGEST